MKITQRIAVRTLVEYALRSGDLEFVFSGPSRLAEGRLAHQKLQNSRPDYYNAEVSVSHAVETDRYVLAVGGRIDGVFTFPDGRIVIEEIKTTVRDDFDSPERRDIENQLHWGQVKVYAFMYAFRNNLSDIDTQLTYYHSESGRTLEQEKRFSIDELKGFFDHLAETYIRWADTLFDHYTARDESLDGMAFPYPAYREGQRALAADVYRTFRSGGQLLVQAATGIGKTMAVIFPALKHIGEGTVSRVFFLTARTTGRVVAEQAVDDLRGRGLKIKSLTLTAKDRICFSPGRVCSPNECVYAKGHYDRIRGAVEDLFKQDAFTRAAVEKIAGEHTVCPFQLSLEISLFSDFIIGDYNYAFDPVVSLKQFFEEGSEKYGLLVDEAHNLVDRSREMFSADIDKELFFDLRSVLDNKKTGLYRNLAKILDLLKEYEKETGQADSRCVETSRIEDLYTPLRKFHTIAEKWLMSESWRDSPAHQALLGLYFRVGWFLRIWDACDETYVVCFSKRNRDLKIKLFCMDPSGQMRRTLDLAAVTVMFSATMTPTDYFKSILGCRETAKTLTLPSPFPPDNLKVFVSDRTSTFYRDREKTIPEVCRVILAMVEQRKGNYLVYFPSYHYMEMAGEWYEKNNSFKDRPTPVQVVIQTPGMKEADKERFLNCFRGDNEDTVVGFAVMGGLFGEGIDLVGERLCGVAIVGVGLPAITPERELIKSHFMKTNRGGFEYAYLYPGINRVLQAAGRVIRSETDRGVVLLVDQRFGSSRYRSLLPFTWRPAAIHNMKMFLKDLNSFWNRDR